MRRSCAKASGRLRFYVCGLYGCYSVTADETDVETVLRQAVVLAGGDEEDARRLAEAFRRRCGEWAGTVHREDAT